MEEDVYSNENETNADTIVPACLDITSGTCTTNDPMMTCADEILLPDIDLYLECIDDPQYVIPERLNLDTHALIGQNVQWKISFPVGQTDKQDTTFPGFSCDECSKFFRKENLLKQHLVSKHGKSQDFACDICDFSTNSNRNLLRHNRRVHHKKPYKESQDVDTSSSMSGERKFSEIPELLYQNKYHKLAKTKSLQKLLNVNKCDSIPLVAKTGYQVDVTQSGFNLDSLDLHQPTPSYGVDSCEKMDMANMCEQTVHVSSVNTPSIYGASDNNDISRECTNVSFKCTECEFVCMGKEKSLLHGHKMRVFCCICSKLFMTVDRFYKHEANVHQVVVPKLQACPNQNCEEMNQLNCNFSDHKQVVSCNAVHKCDSFGCDKSYKSARQLRKHKVLHTGIHVCSWRGCGKVFRDKYNLQTHCSSHTGCKSRKCPYCPYSCVQKSSMNWHIKKKHSLVKEKPFCMQNGVNTVTKTVHVEIIKTS